jgi:hypothetical protein
MPTALNPRIVDRDLSGYFTEGNDDTVFTFVGDAPYHFDGQRLGFAHILERNAIACEVCAELGVRVVDLYSALGSEKLDDFREHFHDMLHFRPRAFPFVAQTVHEGIKDMLV